MGLIYMRISPCGGKYIGQTTKNEKIRWQEHCQEAMNQNSKSYNTVLNYAIRKYGKDNFTCVILEDNIPENLLNEREMYWIAYYNTYYKNNNYGYNMTFGGDGVRRDCSEMGIPILQYDTNGNFIKEWPAVKFAAKHFHSHENNLYAVINHRRGVSYEGFLWKQITDPITVEELIKQYKESQAKRSYKSTKVYCLENNTIYSSFSQAEKDLNVSRKLISKYAKLGQIEPKSKLHFQLIKECL